MDKKKVAKWIIASVAVTAVAAFVAGVAFEVRALKKMNVNMENDVEPKADDFIDGDIA